LYQNRDPNELPRDEYEKKEKKRKTVVCCKLFDRTTKMANEKFIPFCEVISGHICDLTVSFEHIPTRQGIPIDMLIIDFGRDNENNDDDMISM
jgi:hypothetical protein